MIPPRLFFLCSLFVLAGCGGGGGGSDEPAPRDSLTLAAGNAEMATAVSFDGTYGVNEAGLESLGLTQLATGVQVELAGGMVFDASGFVLAMAGQADDYAAALADAVVGVVESETLTCATAGEVTVTVDTAGGTLEEFAAGNFPPGSSLVVEFDGCSDPEFGEWTIDGRFRIVFVSLVGEFGDPGTAVFQLDVETAFTNLTVVGDLAVSGATIDGDMAATIESTGGGVVVFEFSGDRLALTAGERRSTLFDYLLVTEESPAMDAQSFDATIDDSLLNGSVRVVSLEDFLLLPGADYPYDGLARIEGANGSRVRINVLDDVNVRLWIDADGNGEYEQSIDTGWAALEALLSGP